jgi:hypothetical protein
MSIKAAVIARKFYYFVLLIAICYPFLAAFSYIFYYVFYYLEWRYITYMSVYCVLNIITYLIILKARNKVVVNQYLLGSFRLPCFLHDYMVCLEGICC